MKKGAKALIEEVVANNYSSNADSSAHVQKNA